MCRERFGLLVWSLLMAGLLGSGREGGAAEPTPSPALNIPVNRIKHASEVSCVSWSPDGKTLASAGSDTSVRLWDSHTGKEQAILKGHADLVLCVSWSPDGKTLASTSNDGTVKLWDSASGKEQATFHIHTSFVSCVSWSPDGKTLASASADKTVRLWHSVTGKEQAILEGHADLVFCVSWSPDGKTLASASSDNTVRLWETATGKEQASLNGHTGQVFCVSWSPDGKILASASADKTVKLWDATGLGWTPKPALSEEQLNHHWNALTDDTLGDVDYLIWTLAASAETSVPFLKKRLKPAVAPDPVRLARWIADLDDNDFAVRERAHNELANLAELAEPALTTALRTTRSLEVKRRIENLQENLRGLKGVYLRDHRALTALERAGTEEARQLLHDLAQGADAALLTTEAQAACRRLAKRQ